MSLPPHYDETRVRKFIEVWQGSTSEDTTAQTFFRDLCDVLGVAAPPKGAPDEAFRFEKRVPVPEGSKLKKKRADVYRRSMYVWENKSFPRRIANVRPSGWIDRMREAYEQAKRYGKFLADESPDSRRPPILAVCDIGREIWLWDTFSNTDYGTFEDRQEILFEDLVRPLVFQRLQWALSEPQRLNPYRESGRVTLLIAKSLGRLADRLEKRFGAGADGGINESIARFMMACIFTMFAEDMELLTKKVFTEDLQGRWQQRPELFKPEVEALWALMNQGGPDRQLGKVLKFNGLLFANCPVLPLEVEDIQELAKAAVYDWSEVEPSIFGTLLEQSLRSHERSRLGAHFTPREYIERVVRPTIIDPLRSEWQIANAAAVRLASEATAKTETKNHKDASALTKQARQECLTFLGRLRQIKVLDPACGTGNFLYVSLDLLKRLEKEVLVALRDLGETQEQMHAVLVQPDQFFGIEKKPWSKEIAELVLWIGYLQWWRREYGKTNPPEPVLQQYGNIRNEDAVLAYDREEDVLDKLGHPVTVARQGKRDCKSAPMTLKRYVNPREADWPEVDFIVSNPPFIGNKRMRERLGDGYVETLRKVYELPQTVLPGSIGYSVPGDVDFVAYWWHKAAMKLHNPSNRLKRFGFITTNRIRGIQSGAILRQHLGSDLILQFACPDHPWVDPSEELGSAAVRISITVARRQSEPGAGPTLFVEDIDAKRDPQEAARQAASRPKRGAIAQEDGAQEVRLKETRSVPINADLTIGADFTRAVSLAANADICFQGMNLVGEGFRLTPEQALNLGIDLNSRPPVLRKYIMGRDLKEAPVEHYVIDFYGLSDKQAENDYPSLFNHIVREVKPARDRNRRGSRAENWWIFGEPVGRLRKALEGLSQYIATVETSKHRFFVMLPVDVVPDHKLYAIALDDYYSLGVLSSRAHIKWALRTGGTLEDRPTWPNTTTFSPFPFPAATAVQRTRIADLGERIDTLRKQVLSRNPSVSLTNLYDIVELIRAHRLQGETSLPSKWRDTASAWQCDTLVMLHDDLDKAVLDAYGLPANVGDDDLLARLLNLNLEAAEQEKTYGTIRWLRQSYQEPLFKKRLGAAQTKMPEVASSPVETLTLNEAPKWPTTTDRAGIRAQVDVIRDVLTRAGRTLTVEEIVERIEKPSRSRIAPQVRRHLQALETVGAFVSSDDPRGEVWGLGE